MPKQMRWRQRWYDIRCACDLDSDGVRHEFNYDEYTYHVQFNTRARLKIVKIGCGTCGNYHWLYNLTPDDRIYLEHQGLYIGEGITRVTGTRGRGLRINDMEVKPVLE